MSRKRNGDSLKVADSGSTHASRKPEGPLEFSERTVTKRFTTPLFPSVFNVLLACFSCFFKGFSKGSPHRVDLAW